MSPKKRPPLEGRLNTLLPFDAETSALRSLAANEIMSVYARCLEQEMIFRKNSGMDVFPLRFYLRNLFSPDGKVIRVGWEGYGQRLTPVIEELRRSSKDTCILDAGCGYGTESLLFSLFPAKVWGVALFPSALPWPVLVWDSSNRWRTDPLTSPLSTPISSVSWKRLRSLTSSGPWRRSLIFIHLKNSSESAGRNSRTGENSSYPTRTA